MLGKGRDGRERVVSRGVGWGIDRINKPTGPDNVSLHRGRSGLPPHIQHRAAISCARAPFPFRACLLSPPRSTLNGWWGPEIRDSPAVQGCGRDGGGRLGSKAGRVRARPIQFHAPRRRDGWKLGICAAWACLRARDSYCTVLAYLTFPRYPAVLDRIAGFGVGGEDAGREGSYQYKVVGSSGLGFPVPCLGNICAVALVPNLGCLII